MEVNTAVRTQFIFILNRARGNKRHFGVKCVGSRGGAETRSENGRHGQNVEGARRLPPSGSDGFLRQ